MGKTISISNNKGGVGKTSLATNLATGLALKNKKTLLVDMDPQGNATQSFGINKDEANLTMYDLLLRNTNISNIITSTNVKKLHLCPSNINLIDAESELLSKIGREKIFENKIEEKKEEYDFIIIDCPPTLGILSINALACSDSVIVIIEPTEFSLSGMEQFLETIDLVKNINKKLEIEGVLLNRVEKNTKIFKSCFDELKSIFGKKFYPFYIPKNQSISDAQSPGNFKNSTPVPVIASNPKSSGALAYKKLTKEVLLNAK